MSEEKKHRFKEGRKKGNIDVLINADFNSPENLAFQKRFLTEYKLPRDKPLVFVPCASTKKGKGGKLGYSESPTHCFMSEVTRNPKYEKIVLSEPLVMVPYSMENEIPYYNYPPNAIAKNRKDWNIFVDRTAKALLKLKRDDPSRTKAYYVGSRQHSEVLKQANEKAGNPFDIEFSLLKTGYDHKERAIDLDKKIKEHMEKGIRNKRKIKKLKLKRLT